MLLATVEPDAAGRAALDEAGLIYSTDDTPGYTRRRSGKGFAFLDPSGKPLRDETEVRRIKSLAIPPAYTQVWICPHPRGHLQATGRDARGRKQYRYHPRWREVRDLDKFDRVGEFGAALPRIRRAVRRHLALPGLPREKVLATVVKLLETTHVRVGNEEYARDNKSFGLTTLRNRHVRVDRGRIRFEFKGKSGILHEVKVEDPRLARIVGACLDIPGQELFQYIDENEQRRPVDSAAVNAYLKEIANDEFTAKDYRTWAGSLLAYSLLRDLPFDTAAAAQKNVAAIIRKVAERLRNTAAVCRKCYVHPAVIEAYLAQEMPPPATAAGEARRARAEKEFLGFLRRARKRSDARLLRPTPALRGASRPRRSGRTERRPAFV